MSRKNKASTPLIEMEDAYRLLSLMGRTGDNIDPLILEAMNATLIVMEGLESGEIGPEELGNVYFGRLMQKKECMKKVREFFVAWVNAGYAECQPFLDLEELVGAMPRCRFYESGNWNEVEIILTGIAFTMESRRSVKPTASKIKELVAETLSCVSALQIGAHLFSSAYYTKDAFSPLCFVALGKS